MVEEDVGEQSLYTTNHTARQQTHFKVRTSTIKHIYTTLKLCAEQFLLTFAPERQESFMVTRAEVEQFLRDFRVKMKIWGILFRDDRNKNAQTLANLELRPIEREKIVASLQADDYCEGPRQDRLYNGADMWIFGRRVKTAEVYIKITMGYAGSSVICISFHIAEYPLQYPLRQ